MFFSITSQSLDRDEAVRRINLLAGKDLRPMADQYGILVWKNGRENKGWAGLVIEHYLGLPQNSRQAPDFGATGSLRLCRCDAMPKRCCE
jgi:DNA mismatch repair protein MutH